MKQQYQSPKECIYCGATDTKREDEHIIAYSMGGTWILPGASCRKCAEITSKHEGHLSRETYLPLRTRHRFPTYKPKNRPKSFNLELVFEDGTSKMIEVQPHIYPEIYPVLRLSTPGILRGDTPEHITGDVDFDLMGDPKTIEQLWSAYPNAVQFRYSALLHTDSLFITLAKIAHSFTVAHCGKMGYSQFLPPVILGGYPHNKLFFVGGAIRVTSVSEKLAGRNGLEMVLTEEGYIVINIDIMGGKLPSYGVVSGKILDMSKFITNTVAMSNWQSKRHQHGLITRAMFPHEWAAYLLQIFRDLGRKHFPDLMDVWPLRDGPRFDYYALPPDYLLIVLMHSEGPVAGPTMAVMPEAGDFPSERPHENPEAWFTWLGRHHELVPESAWPLLLPFRDSGKSFDIDGDISMMSKQEQDFLLYQINMLLQRQMEKAIAIRANGSGNTA